MSLSQKVTALCACGVRHQNYDEYQRPHASVQASLQSAHQIQDTIRLNNMMPMKQSDHPQSLPSAIGEMTRPSVA
jgi:hypothetical protein